MDKFQLQYPRNKTDAFQRWRTGSSPAEPKVPVPCQCETYRLAKEDLENKYLDFREKVQREYEVKLEAEIQKLKNNTTGELEKLMRATNEQLQREITSLNESKLFLERSRDDAMAKVRDLSIQNQEIILQTKQLQLMDSTRLSTVESELKLKTFELGRCSLLYSEAEAKFKAVEIEREKLAEKLDVVKEELAKVKCESEQKICSLQIQISDKTIRLEAYEKLEDELDKAVVQAAALPEGADADEVLAVYGFGINIPCNAKRRLQQSLSLSRRVMELEHRSSELKESLFKERDQKQMLQRELDAANAAILLGGYPTTELLELIAKKDVEIAKLNSSLKTSQNEIASLKQLEVQLRKVESEKKQLELEIMKHQTATTGSRKSRSSRPGGDSKMKANRVQFKDSHETKILYTNRNLFTPSSATVFCPSTSGIHLKKPLSFSKVSSSTDFET